jgi:outer membrane immunogenic protein
VFGIEADISSSWIEGGSGCCGHGINWLTSVRGRAGLASYDNRWLFYATAGAAWADVDYSSAGFAGHSETQFGWVAGAGIERALTPNLTARIEYLYYDFDGVTAPAGSLGPAAADLDPSMHAVRFGLNFKF